MSKQWYVGMAAGGALFWGINGILSNMLFDRIAISPDWLTTARLLISGAALLLYSLIRRQNIFAIWRQPKNAVLLVSFGLIGVYFAQSNFVRTLYYGNAAVATVLQYMAPALIVIFLAIFRHRWPQRQELIAVILSLVGIVLLVTNGNLAQLQISEKTLFFGILSALGLVAYTLIPGSLLAENDAIVVVGWVMFMGGLAANFVAPLYHPAYHFDTIDLILLFFIVVFGSIVAFVWYIASLRKVAPETVGMLGMLEPLSATILSALVLGVSFHAFQVVGIVMTLGAILIMNVVKK